MPAPDRQEWRLEFAEIRLEFRIAIQADAIVQNKIQLDFFCARPFHEGDVNHLSVRSEAAGAGSGAVLPVLDGKGNRPVRPVVEITDEGRRVLADLRYAGLTEIWYKHDPFDLALVRLDRSAADKLPAILKERLERLEAKLAEAILINEWSFPYIGITKRSALKRGVYRLKSEIAYLREVLGDIDAIVEEVATGKIL